MATPSPVERLRRINTGLEALHSLGERQLRATATMEVGLD
jgi:hypothetical protein